MKEKSNWPCWKIMDCDPGQDCLAKKHPERSCWEIASELNDYRAAMNICEDCIVYLLKEGNTILTSKEKETIMEHKTNCALAA